jgi:pimeloyl-ACP methyl ester carboxylesterase
MERVTSADGTSIAFERSGDGPPLVMIGGALSDRRAGRRIADALGPSLTAVAVDRRGRGDSGDTPPYTVEREVEDVRAILGAVGGSGHLLGHSSGAVLSLEVARTFPDALTSLALYEPPFILDDGRAPLPEDFADRLEELAATGRRDDAVAYFLGTGIGLPEPAIDAARRDASWADLTALAHTLHYDARVVRESIPAGPDPLGRWAAVRVPTLVMDGGASPPWIRSSAAALAAALPVATHRTLEGQGHGPDPSMYAAALTRWVEARGVGHAHPA